MLFYVFLFFVFLWFSAFVVVFILHYIFKKKFFARVFDDVSDDNFLVVYKVKGSDSWGNILIDKKTKQIYYNWVFLDIFQYSLTFFYDFFGYKKLEKHLYSYEDFIVTVTQHHRHWSCFFDYMRLYLPKINKDAEYWLNFFISLYLFIFILAFYCSCPSFLDDLIFFKNVWFLRLFLIVLVWLVSLFILFFFETKNDYEWFYDDFYIKLLVFYWKFTNDLPKIFNLLFCFFVNIILLFILFYFLGLYKILSYTLITYGTIIVFSLLLSLITNRLYFYYPNIKIIGFLSKTKLQTIFSFPLPTFILFYIFKLFWWLNFLLSIENEMQRSFLRSYLSFLIDTKIFKKIINHSDHVNYYVDLDVFLNKIYYFNNYQTKFIYILGKEVFDDGLLKREKTKALFYNKKSWYNSK